MQTHILSLPHQQTQPGETMNPDVQDFLQNVVVDHIDGVMAELLIHQYFTTETQWTIS